MTDEWNNVGEEVFSAWLHSASPGEIQLNQSDKNSASFLRVRAQFYLSLVLALCLSTNSIISTLKTTDG